MSRAFRPSPEVKHQLAPAVDVDADESQRLIQLERLLRERDEVTRKFAQVLTQIEREERQPGVGQALSPSKELRTK